MAAKVARERSFKHGEGVGIAAGHPLTKGS
jgi:hypothetical protein